MIFPLQTSFYPGFRLLDGGEVADLQTQVASSGAVAAGPAASQGNATLLKLFINDVQMAVAGGGVKLSAAVSGLSQIVINSTAVTVTVWPNNYNPLTGMPDQIVPLDSLVAAPSLDLVSGGQILLVVNKRGYWKQMI